MKRIFLAPRSNETAYKNYMSSMQGKSYNEISPYLSEEERGQLQGDDKYFVWGCQPSLRSRWEKMQRGDYVLFYAQGRFISVGRLKFKKFSEDLALSLWPKSQESGEAWSCVFFVEGIQSINLPIEEFNKITGYEIRAVQGFMPVGDKSALSNINQQFGSIDGFIESLTTGIEERALNEIIALSSKVLSEVTEEDKAKLDELTRDKTPEEIERAIQGYSERQKRKTPEQIIKLTKAYKRNVGMVNILKEKYKNKCQICGFTFRTSSGSYYSEAAHVIPISEASVGVDSPDNIWILCANHHKMLDRKALKAIDDHSYEMNGVVYNLLESQSN